MNIIIDGDLLTQDQVDSIADALIEYLDVCELSKDFIMKSRIKIILTILLILSGKKQIRKYRPSILMGKANTSIIINECVLDAIEVTVIKIAYAKYFTSEKAYLFWQTLLFSRLRYKKIHNQTNSVIKGHMTILKKLEMTE